jgi:hypothetical protein
MSDEDVAQLFQLLLHFSMTGSASDKQYQEMNDVSTHSVYDISIASRYFLLLSDIGNEQPEHQLSARTHSAFESMR